MSLPWKILIYIAADNSLYEAALVSLSQIAAASRLGNIEILVQFDGPTPSLASRFRCANGRKQVLWQAPEGFTIHRGERLREFLTWATANLDEGDKRIMLVLWGHGAGVDQVYVYKNPASSPAPPPTSPPRPMVRHGIEFHTKALLNADNANIYVSNIELGSILSGFKSAQNNERKIDILALDACLMGMAEICHEVQDSVSLMVASDEEIPQASFPYDTIVSDLETYPGMDASTLSTLMVSRYVERFAPDEAAGGNPIALSLSSYDLTACGAFATAFKALVKAMKSGLHKAGTMARIVRARDFSRTPLEAAYIDLAVFLTELTESFEDGSAIRKNAQKALTVLLSQPYIVYHRELAEDGAIDSRGLALYFPENLAPEETAAGQSILEETTAAETDTEEKRETHQVKLPIQPNFLAPLPQLCPNTASTKSPTSGGKSPTSGGKTPSGGCKSIVSPEGTSRILTSYRVLWHHYIEMSFNKETGWSSLVEEFLPNIPDAP